MVGALNLISVAFAVLFVGLGVDFGISSASATGPSGMLSSISTRRFWRPQAKSQTRSCSRPPRSRLPSIPSCRPRTGALPSSG